MEDGRWRARLRRIGSGIVVALAILAWLSFAEQCELPDRAGDELQNCHYLWRVYLVKVVNAARAALTTH